MVQDIYRKEIACILLNEGIRAKLTVYATHRLTAFTFKDIQVAFNFILTEEIL